jgi:hypothetical protein
VRRPLGSADLHDPFAALLEEPGKAGTEAARPYHRPAATARDLHASEAGQLLVAGRISTGGGLGQHAAKVVDGGVR